MISRPRRVVVALVLGDRVLGARLSLHAHQPILAFEPPVVRAVVVRVILSLALEHVREVLVKHVLLRPMHEERVLGELHSLPAAACNEK